MTMSYAAPPLTAAMPWPLVKFNLRNSLTRNLRGIWNIVLQVIWVVAVAYLGAKVFAGLYYVVLEMVPWMTERWHAAVPDSVTRHAIRDVGEGFAASITAQGFIWNHWRPVSVFSRVTPFRQVSSAMGAVERFLHLPTGRDDKLSSKWALAFGVFLTFIYAIPGFYLGRWGVDGATAFIHGHSSFFSGLKIHLPGRAQSLWDKEQVSIIANGPTKLIGVFCGICFGRRMARGVYDDLQYYSVRRRRASGKDYGLFGKSLLPPGYLARYNDLAATKTPEQAKYDIGHDHVMKRRTLIILIAIPTILFVIGEFVLLFIAKH